jgi:hypothetical protein
MYMSTKSISVFTVSTFNERGSEMPWRHERRIFEQQCQVGLFRPDVKYRDVMMPAAINALLATPTQQNEIKY